MKHLKRINELYLTSDVSSVIDDILLEINDIPKFVGLNWNHTDRLGRASEHSFLVIIKLSEGIEDGMDYGVGLDEEITETIKRLLEFMTSNRYEYLMEFGTDNIPPGTSKKELSAYIRKFEYSELADNDLTMWVDEFIRITFTK